MSKTHPIFERVFRTYDKLNGVVQENLHGIRVVKAFVREEHEEKKFTSISERIYQDFRKVAAYEKPADMINGYEYEVFECKRCIEEGLLESPLMPHAETIDVMCQMDKLREEWGVKYPMD